MPRRDLLALTWDLRTFRGAERIRGMLDEIREAMAQYVGELLATPEAQRPAMQQKIAERTKLSLEQVAAKVKALTARFPIY